MASDRVSPKRQIRRAGVRRQVVHKVSVSTEQETLLEAQAAERGVTISRLLVENALAGGADAAAANRLLAAELFGVVRVLGRVAVNVNQLAKVTNATGEVQESTVHALDAVTRICDRLWPWLDEMGFRR